MRTNRCILLGIAYFLLLFGDSVLNAASPDEGTAAKEIEGVIQQFFNSLSKRDATGMKEVLTSQFAGVEAGNPNARVEWINTTESEKLLPPKGNNDWKEMKIAEVKVEVSSTHPSVAMVSFSITFPLDAKKAAAMETAIKQDAGHFTDAQKKVIEKMIKDRVVANSMFAMLAHEKGKWKIVSLSLPH